MPSLQTIWDKWRYPLGRVVTNTAAMFGITTGVAWLISVFAVDRTHELLVQSSALALIALLSVLALIIVGVQIAPGKQVVNALSDFDKASVSLRDFHSFVLYCLENPNGDVDRNIEVARNLLTDALDVYSHVFSNVTGTRCRLCIKMFYEHKGKQHVYTLARDWSSWRQYSQDDKVRYETHHDVLELNTDFLMLYDPAVNDKGYFYSPNLEKHEGYASSSNTYWQRGRHFSEWQLPYKTSIVWPIRQDKRPDLGYTDDRLIGFLALDANIINAFSEDRDVSMGRPLASLLYLVLQPFQELMAVRTEDTDGTGDHDGKE
ncbi:hypothetical protein V5T82_17525 [Magnetovibrio sp. PR-2]|uniref:hypothetical protein n=1 Tax=Magnetovibrio sp. PR-2 TaxID=3120356 RepID=UPI002FCDEFDA